MNFHAILLETYGLTLKISNLFISAPQHVKVVLKSQKIKANVHESEILLSIQNGMKH